MGEEDYKGGDEEVFGNDMEGGILVFFGDEVADVKEKEGPPGKADDKGGG